MPPHPATRLLALAAAALAASCTSLPVPAGASYVRSIELPPDVAAAVAAGAVRLALSFADPVPGAAGAPASCHGSSRYSITYQRDGRGRWSPSATHRLTVTPEGLPSPRVTVLEEPLQGNLALQPRPGATDAIRIEIHPGPAGSIVRARLPAPAGARIAQFLDRSFTLAIDPGAAELGLDEPNLEALVCHNLAATAAGLLEHGRPGLAERHLVRAARMNGSTAALHRRLGELAARSGDAPAAREQFTQALLMTTDPTERAMLARMLGSIESRGGDRTHLHREADELAAAADFDGAETVLHTARRRTPLPAEDYRLSSHLHLRRNDPMAALGCALLAREHQGAEDADAAAAIAGPRSAAPMDVAERFLRGAPAAASPPR